MGNFVPFSTWQAAPYAQDAGSSMSQNTTTPTTTGGPTSTTVPPATTTTVPAAAGTNYLDANTATLEGALGRWAPWYAATPSRSTLNARTGTASLRADIIARYGWGIQLNNYPGFAATSGNKSIGFWAIKGAGANLGVNMTVRWKGDSGGDLRIDTLSVASLTTSWQEARMSVIAPSGTATMTVEFWSSSGGPGDYLFLDQVFVG
jgi:hypothetical protein